MNCSSCQIDQGLQKEVTIKLPIYGRIFEINDVPVLLCHQCGEQVLSESVHRRLILMAQELESDGKNHGSFSVFQAKSSC